MNGQMSIFDILFPDRINPIRALAVQASPHWVQSRETIRNYQKALAQGRIDIKEFARAVKHQYIPWGPAGHYGSDRLPNTLDSWDLKSEYISIKYTDEQGMLQERFYSWEGKE